MGFFYTGYVAFLAMTAAVVTAQNNDCIGNLLPCANFLNTTGKPSNECCTGIRQVVSTQITCLCRLYNNPSLGAGIGINITQALMLPARCDITADVGICKASAPALPPGSSTFPPPATPGGSSGDNGNGAGTRSRISWVGMAALSLAWFLY